MQTQCVTNTWTKRAQPEATREPKQQIMGHAREFQKHPCEQTEKPICGRQCREQVSLGPRPFCPAAAQHATRPNGRHALYDTILCYIMLCYTMLCYTMRTPDRGRRAAELLSLARRVAQSLVRSALFGCGLMGSTLMGSLQKYYVLMDLNKY